MPHEKQIIGECTLYRGNSTEIMQSIRGVDCVITDPPYGVSYQSNKRKDKHDKIKNDEQLHWVTVAFSNTFDCLKDDSFLVSFYGWPHIHTFMQAWINAGFVPKSHLVWVKNNIGLGWFTRSQHEPAFLLAKGKPKKPKKAISDVISAPRTRNDHHPTEKPVLLMSKLIEAFSDDGALIMDPFMGSGTTLVSCVNTGRKAIGIELEAKYFDIACKRVEDTYRQTRLML